MARRGNLFFPPRLWRRRFAVVLAIVVMAPAIQGALVPARAAVVASFTKTWEANTTGDIILRGNTLMSCPGSATGCTTARGGTGGNLSNNDWGMAFVDADAESTFNSSSAEAALPAGATVLFAGLYWAGDTDKPDGGMSAPDAGLKDRAKFKVPGASSYAMVTASECHDEQTESGGEDVFPYQCYANVTTQVKAASTSGGPYWVADVQSARGRTATPAGR